MRLRWLNSSQQFIHVTSLFGHDHNIMHIVTYVDACVVLQQLLGYSFNDTHTHTRLLGLLRNGIDSATPEEVGHHHDMSCTGHEISIPA